ncbi:hypothetical protein [Streptomyces albidoflavus]|uniref:hypothetical protein n=1 Tax=Streptomyces albidoflavus TaxID=1886 RepID=UPI0033C6572A
MGDARTLVRGARVGGSVVCAALAVVTLGWVLRDLAYSGDPRELWWRWASMPTSYGAQDVVYTAGPDLFLAVVYVAVAVRVPRSTSAAALLAVTGALTVVLRLPSLAVLGELPGATRLFGGPYPGAMLTTLGAVLGGIALIVMATAGSRFVPWEGATGAPGRLSPVRARAAGGALLLCGGILLWREIFLVDAMAEAEGGPGYFATYLAPDTAPRSLLLGAGGWVTVVQIVLVLAVAGVCFARTGGARALGLVAASQVVAVQAVALTAYVEGGIYEQFSERGPAGQLQSLAPPVLCALALVGLVLLLRRPPRPGPVPWRAPAPGPYAGPGPR